MRCATQGQYARTDRFSERSALLPTRTMMTSFPRSPLTSSTHFRVFWNDFASEGSLGQDYPWWGWYYLKYRKQLLPRWNRECRMESDSETVLGPPYPIIVIARFDLRGTWSAQVDQHLYLPRCRALLTFERKSIPIVAWYMLSKESYIKRVIRDVFPTVSVSAPAWKLH